jgi:hypothetical protein
MFDLLYLFRFDWIIIVVSIPDSEWECIRGISERGNVE